MPGDAISRLKENLKVENVTIGYKDIKLNKPAGRRAAYTDELPSIYTPVFTNIIDPGQEYLPHRLSR